MIPLATGDPGSRAHHRCEIFDARDEFGRRSRVPQLDGSQAAAATQKVHVGVNESGSYHPTARVDDTCVSTGQTPDLLVRPDRRDPIAADRYGLCPWLRRLTGPDDSVDDHDRNWLLPQCHGSGSAL